MNTSIDHERFVGLIEIELRKMIAEVSAAVEAKQSVLITQQVERDDESEPWGIKIHPFSRPGETIITWTVKIVK